jgi:ribonuclease VapC
MANDALRSEVSDILFPSSGSPPLSAHLQDLTDRARGHPAGLKLADCFSYALAKRADEALLVIGNDFSETDIEVA